MKMLRPDDDNLLNKLQAIPPQERGAALAQIHRDWKSDQVFAAAHEWLVLAMRLDDAPDSPEINFLFGQVTERLRWVAHRVPGTRATPETLALSSLKSRRALDKGRPEAKAENAARAEDRADRVAHLQRIADDVWARHPDWFGTGVAREILRKWRDADGPKPKIDYIRKRIKKPGQA